MVRIVFLHPDLGKLKNWKLIFHFKGFIGYVIFQALVVLNV